MSQAVVTHITPALTIEDISLIGFTARISHRRLAEALNYAQPHKFGHLIERHLEALWRFGEVSSTVDETSEKGGRPGKTWWLSKKQALYLCAKSETETATEITIQMVEVFDAFLDHRARNIEMEPGVIWMHWGKNRVMVDTAAPFVGKHQRGVVCDECGKISLVHGPLEPVHVFGDGRLVYLPWRKRGNQKIRRAVTLLGIVMPFALPAPLEVSALS